MGQARKSLWIETSVYKQLIALHSGQARKSLWIETVKRIGESFGTKVRLVRACGSKLSKDVLTMRRQMVRLVRACGSKPQLQGIL